MTLDNPKSGMGVAHEYSSSGLPYVVSATAPAAGSPVEYRFPKVTRFITISNRDATASNSMSFGFTRAGVIGATNKFFLMGNQSITLELRVRDLWVQGEGGTPAYSMCAGLTNIDRINMPVLTGSAGGWDGVG